MIEASREARLAALAEPRRLAIADALAAGDLSPTELAAATGQPSNLLAHHLGALERAGVVRRRPSDADGRRTYLTLAWEDPIVAASVAAPSPGTGRVVFVCAGNSARSQMAASLLASLGADAASAGTRPADALHPLAVAELASRGLTPLADRPLPLADVLRPGDRVIAVCDTAYETLGADAAPVHWSIAATAGGDRGAFTRAFDDLAPRVERLAHALTTGEAA